MPVQTLFNISLSLRALGPSILCHKSKQMFPGTHIEWQEFSILLWHKVFDFQSSILIFPTQSTINSVGMRRFMYVIALTTPN